MTGQELINWIVEHKAQDMQCVVQYRDGGGPYSGGEIIENPTMASFKGAGVAYSDEVSITEISITYGNGLNPNCIVL